ncbi:MAG: hypothetical protein ACRCSV_02545 [Chlamydiales bacterium]
MINPISTNSITDANNRFYTACNIISTIALFALKEATSLAFTPFAMLGITTLVANYFIFDAIATSSLNNKKKFIPLQISLIALIVLGCAVTNIIFISPAFFLSKILSGLISAKISFCIADLPAYMLLLSVVSCPLETFSKIIHLFKKIITIHNRLLQQLRSLNSSSHQRTSVQITSAHCFQFILSFLLEAITRGVRDEIDTNQNTIVFEHSPILAPYLITHINETTQPILNPSRFLDISEYLQALPQEVEFQEDRMITFQTLVFEFQKLSIDLQKKYCNQILQHHDLQWIVPTDLGIILQEYHNTHIDLATDVDVIITTGVSFTKEMLEFANKKRDVQRLDELNDIMIRYTSLQNSFRESLSHQPENTDARRRIISLINSLYLLYEKNIVPMRFQFPYYTSNDDMDQPAWNYLASKFPYDFFENLPTHLFSNTQDPNKLDEDFKKYKISTAREFIKEIFNDDIEVFRASRKEQVIEKLINYCTNNSLSNKYKIQFLKIRNQAHEIIKISTAIFTSIVAPLLIHPKEFAAGSIYAVISKKRISPASIHNVSTSLLEGFFLTVTPFGGLWAGCQFTGQYIVPLLD